MTRRAVVIAARRTPVAPRGGSLSHLQADELAAPVFDKLVEDAGLDHTSVDHVLMGNALYAGGNPARMAALRAGLPETVPALTLDTQCCSGLDAIIMAARLIESGAADCVLAGGTESFSRAPLRLHRPLAPVSEPIAYSRPPFAPPPFSDPDLTEAAAALAGQYKLCRTTQAEFAVGSHDKARAAAASIGARLVDCPGTGLKTDSFTRGLTSRTALRAPVLAGNQSIGLTAATIACEADAAAAVLLVSDDLARDLQMPGLQIMAAGSRGGDPADPALVPIGLARDLLAQTGKSIEQLSAIEIHEAYAVQAMITAQTLAVDPRILNPLGGGLARGHPIGASGAILMEQMFQSMRLAERQGMADEFQGMALIAAAGGLSAGILVEGCSIGSE